jgi:hypothetical protein
MSMHATCMWANNEAPTNAQILFSLLHALAYAVCSADQWSSFHELWLYMLGFMELSFHPDWFSSLDSSFRFRLRVSVP